MNADARVMEFFPRLWSKEESRAALARVEEEFEQRGFGVYAVESGGAFAGITGLSMPGFEAHFTPAVEILWRLAYPFWGKGFASEAAGAVLRMAFETLGLAEVVAFAVADNARSIRVMEKIGMKRDPAGDFDHPAVRQAALRRHVLYRAGRATTDSGQARAGDEMDSHTSGRRGATRGGTSATRFRSPGLFDDWWRILGLGICHRP